MLKSCLHILLIYLRRPQIWLAIFPLLAIDGFFITQMVLHPWPAGRVATDLFIAITVFLLSYVLSLVMQLRLHMACPQASLFPHYRPPHILVAMTLLLSPIVAGCLLGSAALHVPWLPLLGLNLVLGAVTAWFVYALPTRLLGIAFVLALLGTQYAPLRQFIPHFITAGTARQAEPFLLVGSFAFIAFGAYLLKSRHQLRPGALDTTLRPWEMRLYSSGIGTNLQHPRMTALNLALQPGDRPFARLRTLPVRSLWRRLARRRLGQANRRGASIAGSVFMALQFFIHPAGAALQQGFGCGLLLLVPTVLTLAFVYRLHSTLAQEVLRPMTRSALLHELAIYLALQTLEVWLAMAITLVAGTALLSPAQLGQFALWVQIVASLVLQVPVLAAISWFARYQFSATAHAWTIPFLCLSTLTVVPGIARLPGYLLTPPALAFGAAGILLIGGLIAADAYRRWLHTNLA